MIKLFNDPIFLLEVFYDYNEEVDGTARKEEANRDKFNEICKLFKKEYEEARKLQDEKKAFIHKKINKVGTPSHPYPRILYICLPQWGFIF